MKTIVSIDIAAMIAGLIFEIPAFLAGLPTMRDSASHIALSRVAWFILLTAILYIIIRKYVHVGYTSVKMARYTRQITLVASFIVMMVVFAVQILRVDMFVSIPHYILNYTSLWYALPLIILINFVVLYVIEKN